MSIPSALSAPRNPEAREWEDLHLGELQAKVLRRFGLIFIWSGFHVLLSITRYHPTCAVECRVLVPPACFRRRMLRTGWAPYLPLRHRASFTDYLRCMSLPDLQKALRLQLTTRTYEDAEGPFQMGIVCSRRKPARVLYSAGTGTLVLHFSYTRLRPRPDWWRKRYRPGPGGPRARSALPRYLQEAPRPPAIAPPAASCRRRRRRNRAAPPPVSKAGRVCRPVPEVYHPTFSRK